MVNWRGWRKRSKNSSKKQEDYCQAQGSEEARETGPWSVAGQLSPLEEGQLRRWRKVQSWADSQSTASVSAEASSEKSERGPHWAQVSIDESSASVHGAG